MHTQKMTLVWVLVLFLTLASGYAKEDAGRCLELGFESTTLQCKTCIDLKRVLGDGGSQYYDECLSCCNTVDEDDMYGFAVYQGDRKIVKAQEGLMGILNEVRQLYGSAISVKHRANVAPTLRFYREKGDKEVAMTENVHGWDNDLLKEFLEEHLRPPSPSDGAGAPGASATDAGPGRGTASISIKGQTEVTVEG
jgi:hypothetical protein